MTGAEKHTRLKSIAELESQFSDPSKIYLRNQLCRKLNKVGQLHVVAGTRNIDVRHMMLEEYFGLTPEKDYYWLTKPYPEMGEKVARELRLNQFLDKFVHKTKFPEGYEDRYLHLKKVLELVLNELDGRLEFFSQTEPLSSMGLLPVRVELIKGIVEKTGTLDARDLAIYTASGLAKLVKGLGPKGANKVIDHAKLVQRLSSAT